MAFNFFPFSDFHDLNFDWMLKKWRDIYDKIPVKLSQLVNDMGFIRADQAPVQSVNSKIGNVVLDASDVGALPDTYVPPVTSVNSQTGDVELDASDVGALPDTYVPPVTSVNSQTGAVMLDAADVGALPDTYVPPVTSVNSQTGAVMLDAADVGALPAGTGIIIDTVVGASTQIPAGGHVQWSESAAKTGYTPLGIICITKSGSGQSNCIPNLWTIENNNVYCDFRNIATSNITIIPTFTVLYIKN